MSLLLCNVFITASQCPHIAVSNYVGRYFFIYTFSIFCLLSTFLRTNLFHSLFFTTKIFRLGNIFQLSYTVYIWY